MTRPPLNDPNAAYWEDLVEEFDFDSAETAEIQRGADEMISAVRAHRLAESTRSPHT